MSSACNPPSTSTVLMTSVGYFPLLALSATANGVARELLYKRALRTYAHPLCAALDLLCFSAVANKLLTSLQGHAPWAALTAGRAPAALSGLQLCAVGATWVGCMAAFEAVLVRVSGRERGQTQSAGSAQPIDSKDTPSAQASSATEGSPTAGAPSQPDPEVSGGSAPATPTSFWEDGRAWPYLLIALAAVPTVVAWTRRAS